MPISAKPPLSGQDPGRRDCQNRQPKALYRSGSPVPIPGNGPFTSNRRTAFASCLFRLIELQHRSGRAGFLKVFFARFLFVLRKHLKTRGVTRQNSSSSRVASSHGGLPTITSKPARSRRNTSGKAIGKWKGRDVGEWLLPGLGVQRRQVNSIARPASRWLAVTVDARFAAAREAAGCRTSPRSVATAFSCFERFAGLLMSPHWRRTAAPAARSPPGHRPISTRRYARKGRCAISRPAVPRLPPTWRSRRASCRRRCCGPGTTTAGPARTCESTAIAGRVGRPRG